MSGKYNLSTHDDNRNTMKAATHHNKYITYQRPTNKQLTTTKYSFPSVISERCDKQKISLLSAKKHERHGGRWQYHGDVFVHAPYVYFHSVSFTVQYLLEGKFSGISRKYRQQIRGRGWCNWFWFALFN